MKRVGLLLLTIPLSILLTSCEGSIEDEKRVANEATIERFLSSNNLPFEKKEGVYKAIREKGFGYQVNSGDSLAFWYIGYTLTGIIFDTNIPEVADDENLDISGRPLTPLKIVENSNNLIEGLKRGIRQCREGEYTTLLFPSSLGYGETNMGPVAPWSPLAFNVFIIYVKNDQIEQEQNIISNFVASSGGFSIDSITGSWKRYLIQNLEDTIPSINYGDTIYGFYKESSLDGTLINQTPKEGQELVLDADVYTEGVIYGFKMMKVGEVMELVVSSAMGYGNEGNEIVTPYIPLIYEFRLDSIK